MQAILSRRRIVNEWTESLWEYSEFIAVQVRHCHCDRLVGCGVYQARMA
jgi:hypothetical protein